MKKHAFKLLLCIVVFVFIFVTGPLCGQSFDNIIGFGGSFSTVLDLKGDIYGGFAFRFLPISKLGLFLDFDVGKKYYQYDGGSWSGPFSWGLIDADITRGNWLFFHTEGELVFSVVTYFSKKALQPYLGAGALVRMNQPGDAVEYYPDFSKHYEDYKNALGVVYGILFRLGLDLFISIPWISYGLELNTRVVDLPHLGENLSTYGFAYLLGESHLTLNVMIWPVQRR